MNILEKNVANFTMTPLRSGKISWIFPCIVWDASMAAFFWYMGRVPMSAIGAPAPKLFKNASVFLETVESK